MAVELKHRFGGHGGITTEWEITSDYPHAKQMIESLPDDLWPIQVTPKEQYSYHYYSIILPEGVSTEDAGTVAALWDSDEPTGLRLLAKLREVQNKSILNPTWKSEFKGWNTRVTTAFIRNATYDKLLLARRPSDAAIAPGVWETPGGKCEEWEQLGEGLTREIKEELGVNIIIDDIFAEIYNIKDHRPESETGFFDITAWVIQIHGTPQPLASSELRWWSIDELLAKRGDAEFMESFWILFPIFLLYREGQIDKKE